MKPDSGYILSMQNPILYFSDELAGLLPDGLDVAYTTFTGKVSKSVTDPKAFSAESLRVLNALSNRMFSHACHGSCAIGSFVEFEKETGGQPFGRLSNGLRIFVSITHSKNTLATVISDQFAVGIDLEPTDRVVHDRLRQRIAHIQDQYTSAEPIQIWTIKEAVLKLLGTGLRTPMNQLQIVQESPELFRVHHSDITYMVVSFCHQTNWVSVAWQPN
jgi:phosphopantetheinyl transferase